jgi:hypothetical protein
MIPVPRLTLSNLLEMTLSLPDNVRNDPWRRSYALGVMVVKYFMGQEWAIKHLTPKLGAKGFLQVKTLNISDIQKQAFRAVDLGELLFNLQHVENFGECFSRLKGGDVESALAELDIARMLYINDQMFWFVERQQRSQTDYDFQAICENGILANIEAKCNLETPEVNLGTIKTSLKKARTQVPPDLPGIVFIKLPSQWIEEPNFVDNLAKLTNDFFRTTKRIVSAKYYAAPLYFDGARLGQGHRFIEFNSASHRFGDFHNWDLLKHWRPRPGRWNLLPKKWVRLVFFPHNDPRYDPGFKHEEAK